MRESKTAVVVGQTHALQQCLDNLQMKTPRSGPLTPLCRGSKDSLTTECSAQYSCFRVQGPHLGKVVQESGQASGVQDEYQLQLRLQQAAEKECSNSGAEPTAILCSVF